MNFTIYNTDNAPEESKPFLEAAREKFGFLPNLLGEFAESPALLEGYLKLNEIVGKTDFTPKEQQLAILAVSVENKCHYCTAVHSTILRNQINADDEIVDAVRNGDPLPDSKLNALVTYVKRSVQKRGFVEESDLQAFLDAGYSKRQALEVNLVIALKTMSNYTNHLAVTPVDEPFEPEKVEFATV
ncbi:carboxymuconolactone decarboxylase family protein [Halalkalibaculum sp. DA3122]|uniref:carboxymuconolactone decarboxylase family protein n=1 Tax=Halalkalibaculum sp. DA3122 TaxID=3373607 RepID=UPI003754F3B2